LHGLWILRYPLYTLLDVLGQVRYAGIQQRLLVSGQLANIVNLFNTLWAKLDLRGEELAPLALEQRAVDECRLNDTLLTLGSLEQALGEASTSHSHRQSSRSSTILGLDDLVTTELNAVDQFVELLADNVGVARLRD
jgi:hypothetical protein